MQKKQKRNKTKETKKAKKKENKEISLNSQRIIAGTSDGTANRSSHRRCSVRKGVLRNFVKFTEKHLCRILFFNKVAGLRPEVIPM